jgi:hypothetical protein
MSKYEPLNAFLAGRNEREVAMSFAEIEMLIGASLPPSAFKHRAWWSNNPSNSVITDAWLRAGYQTERVDLGSRRLVFRKTDRGDRSSAQPPPVPGLGRGGVLARLRSVLGGTVRFKPDLDPTAPTGEAWDADR